MKILLLDNYDSFTYNLLHYLEAADNVTVDVFRNDQISVDDVDAYEKIVISPGPGLPSNAGILPALLKRYQATKSILGVCLGHQAIAECFGGSLSNLPKVHHGMAAAAKIVGNTPLFHNLPAEFKVGRYHSWTVDTDSFPDSLQITAVDEDREILALQHRVFRIQGVQFHPESVLSEFGLQIIDNWMRLC